MTCTFILQLSTLLLLFGASSSSTFHDPDNKKAPPFRALSEVELERFLPIIGASPGQVRKGPYLNDVCKISDILTGEGARKKKMKYKGGRVNSMLWMSTKC